MMEIAVVLAIVRTMIVKVKPTEVGMEHGFFRQKQVFEG